MTPPDPGLGVPQRGNHGRCPISSSEQEGGPRGSKDASSASVILAGDAGSTPRQAVGSLAYPEGGLRAWAVVLGSFSGMLASFGLMNSIGIFQAYVSTHQLAQYSDGTVGWIFSGFVFLVRQSEMIEHDLPGGYG